MSNQPKNHRQVLRRPGRALAALLLLGAAVGAQAVNLTQSDQLIYNTDVVKFGFTLDAATPVTLWTDSWKAGLNFDPELALFDAGSNLIAIGDDTSDPTKLLPGQGGYDSQIRIGTGGLVLASGSYSLVLSASSNDPLGPTLGDGFSLFGTMPIAIANWNQPSYDINTNDQKGGFWQVHLDGIGAAVAAPVPEPAEWLLLLGGLSGLAVFRPQRRRDPKPPLASENTTSTRRFSCRPAAVALVATA